MKEVLLVIFYIQISYASSNQYEFMLPIRLLEKKYHIGLIAIPFLVYRDTCMIYCSTKGSNTLYIV